MENLGTIMIYAPPSVILPAHRRSELQFPISHNFVDEVARELFYPSLRGKRRIQRFFEYWHRRDPASLEKSAEAVGRPLEELLTGSSEAALSVITGHAHPWPEVRQFFSAPLTSARLLAAKMPSRRTIDAFEQVGLRSIIEGMPALELNYSTPHLKNTVERVLNLLGFSNLEEYWEATFALSPRGPLIRKERFAHPNEFTPSGLTLPFNDYALVCKFVRGLEELVLTAHHHSARAAQEGIYMARTLIGNCKVLESLPTITEEGARVRYSRRSRDPLTCAFIDNYTLDLQNGKYAYHPRVLVEALTEKLQKPEHLYFFYRSVGIQLDASPRPDLEEQIQVADEEEAERHFHMIIPALDTRPIPDVEKIMLDFDRGTVNVDVSLFKPILETENGRRMRDVKSLSNLSHLRIPYATQSRRAHMIGVMHFAGILCDLLKIRGYDRLKAQTYGLVHDWGHLTGSHPTELYFKALAGFDHEEFTVELIRRHQEAFASLVDPEDIIKLLHHQDPLHSIVDGPFGVDRIYFMGLDPHEYGMEKEFDSLSIFPFLAWRDGQVVVEQHLEKAFEFLDYRAKLYEQIYFAPSTQIADAYQKKMLYLAGITSPHQELKLPYNQGIVVVPKEGITLRFSQLNDSLFQYYLANHQNLDAREIMRHLMVVYHKAPHATVAALKLVGAESAEPTTEFPDYHRLRYVTLQPHVERVVAEKMEHHNQALFHPQKQQELEEEIARRVGIPARHVIVATVPNMQKLASEYAPVRRGHEIKSLFEWNPAYQEPFRERAKRMACVRVAVHPQLYPLAYDFFRRESFQTIVREVLGDR